MARDLSKYTRPPVILSGFLPEAGTPKKRDAVDGNVLYI